MEKSLAMEFALMIPYIQPSTIFYCQQYVQLNSLPPIGMTIPLCQWFETRL